MSTRGLIGFVADGELKGSYVHYDMYPSGVGADALKLARILADEDMPTEEKITHVISLSDEEYTVENASFGADSLFCEYAYIFDLDNSVLEAYVGYQKEDHSDGRFAGMKKKNEDWVPDYPGQNYYAPIRLVGSWKFTDLPTQAGFENVVDGPYEDN